MTATQKYNDPTLASIKTCYATPSAGMHPNHTLPLKLRAIADAGFDYAEIAFPDLEAYATEKHGDGKGKGYRKINNRGEGDVKLLCESAQEIAGFCKELGLTILALHPFSQFEGYEDTTKREEGFDRARTWFQVLKALDCRMLQVGSNNDPASSGNLGVIARDLRQLADEAAAMDPPVKIAYEMWAWGVYVNTWEHTWAVCKRVDRANFGLCLDTFQIAARAYADPLSPTGLLTTRTPTSQTPAEILATSLSALTTTLDPHKIFYFQISDASRPLSPSALIAESKALSAQQDLPVHPLYAWSNAYRPLPFQSEENGAYISDAVVQICRAVLRTGWRGPWSYEVFYKKGMEGKSEEIPSRWTRDAMNVHARILKEIDESEN